MPKQAPKPGVPPKRFSDYQEGSYATELQIAVTDLIGREIIVKDCQERQGDYGPYLVVLCAEADDPDTEFTTAIGGVVVMRKIQEMKTAGRLPLVGRIEKPAQYYDIV